MFKFIPQHDQMDCGPACLAMISSKYGKQFSLQYLRDIAYVSREGVSVLGITIAAEHVGLDHMVTRPTLKQLKEFNIPLPCILHWKQNHFVVLNKIKKSIISPKIVYKIVDPAYGFISLSEDKFKNSWISDHDKGVAILLTPSKKFYNQDSMKNQNLSLKYLISYLIPHKKSLATALLFLLIGSMVSLTFPFLTQNLIDKGVNVKDLHYITIILLAQLALFFGSMITEMFRNWIMLTVGTKINIKIISDFFKKLLKLPLHFFDTKMMGDFNQRIHDHERIETFLTSQSLLTFFSMITFLVFFGVLWYYNINILILYLCLTVVAIGWSLIWLDKRKSLDYFLFQQRSENQESIYEMINGVTEMKLNQFENYKRNEWEQIQQRLLKVNIRILKLAQIQVSGFDFINQVKNIIVTFLAASLVVKGNMTLGALLGVSYIIGQMNSPISQLMNFFRSLQDAKLSLARLNEVQQYEEEEKGLQIPLINESSSLNSNAPVLISIKNLSFHYEGAKSIFVLDNISFNIPAGQVTAIVGSSGSGKTTFIKMLLKFYLATHGEIMFGEKNLHDISTVSLRSNCGVVMQDGYLFGDTIERNIVCADEDIDYDRLQEALRIANIKDFIKNLSLGLNTKIGASGNGLSGGQKQRILIARAVYKNPAYLFLDEATSALDAENEKIIHDRLQTFFKGRTVVIIAHRLSTVKNADQIIVLKRGKIVEYGNHINLVTRKADYFNLVRNQLELGA